MVLLFPPLLAQMPLLSLPLLLVLLCFSKQGKPALDIYWISNEWIWIKIFHGLWGVYSIYRLCHYRCRRSIPWLWCYLRR
uniref:Uncharacterized protein n=2 Tax=Picea TaxID=3328 RepID=A0A101LVZ9_PICGL|nr:hypothetical protein ABT39_MTgene1478 [Picea glauca]QHR92674.1 hypothetical protein Q903MT_gene6722 [Picea sitchensis]